MFAASSIFLCHEEEAGAILRRTTPARIKTRAAISHGVWIFQAYIRKQIAPATKEMLAKAGRYFDMNQV